jgi:hypothetical protein
MKRLLKRLAVVGVVLAAVIPAAATQASAAPYCGITWGSLAKGVSVEEQDVSVTNVRSGQHACYDRLVIDNATWANVRYVSRVTEDPSGRPVSLRGGAFLQIVTTRAYAGTHTTYNPANKHELVNVSGYRTFRQAAWAGNFEGRLTLGLGVRGRLPFRAFVLTAPGVQPRVVIDVAHLW